MNNNVYNIKNIAGKYYLYFGDEQVMTSEGAEIFTTSEELANLLLNDAVEYGADTENVLSILADGFSVGLERTVRINVYVEQNGIGEAGFFQFGYGARTLSANVSAHIDTRYDLVLCVGFLCGQQDKQ